MARPWFFSKNRRQKRSPKKMKDNKMLKVTFTFRANSESDPHKALHLFKESFPGACSLGYAMRLDNFYRVTCTSEEFCKWIYQRDQMGFVNRMHQLNIRIETFNTHYQRQPSTPNVARAGYAANPIVYETPESSSVKAPAKYHNV